MTQTLGVFGLGYVGCVSAACFAKAGWHVIGVDVNDAKVDMINRGTSPVVEAGVVDLVREVVADGRLRATTDPGEAVTAAAISLICVGTPSRPNGALDTTYVARVCEDIGRALRERHERHIVVVRSTVMPGTTATVVTPILERAAQRKVGDGLAVCVNPEFLREGTSLQDFYHPAFTLIGSDDRSVACEVAELYGTIDAPLHIIDTKAAEIVKYACNAFHGLKVAFANEIGNICRAMNIDGREVMRVFCEDRKLNVSPYYLKPGFAFGGSCLPKDLRAILYQAKQVDVELPMLNATLETNRRQLELAFNLVRRTEKRRVGVLGLSFKAGTDDLRESPIVLLIETLIGKGYKVVIYDEEVALAKLVGANRRYIEETIPHISSLMLNSPQEVMESCEVVVISKKTSPIREALTKNADGRVVIDLVRALEEPAERPEHYEGLCW